MKIYTYGNPNADILLVQMVDDHDLEGIEREVAHIQELTNKDFYLKAIQVENWNRDLSPWHAPAVFGDEDFEGKADSTLDFLLEELKEEKRKRIYIGGYSLAGLFALWAVYKTNLFDGVAAASPSIWFENFTEYMKENPMQADSVYLSLGDREERTRNPIMSTVGNKIKEAYAILDQAGKKCALEWNKGNHFKNPDLRTAKAFAWVMNQDKKKAMVSACLLGENCKYNGGNNKNEKLIKYLEDFDVISICPEQMGGLPTPRIPSEICNGIVCTKDGRNVDENFRLGASKCLDIAMKEKPDVIILQSRSPSCGVKQIYDGSFSGRLIDGSGITAALLKENGFHIIDVEDLKNVGS